MGKWIGPVQRKILLLLMAGAALGLTRSPRRYFKILQLAKKEWQAIDRDALKKAIRSLYESRMITTRDNPDGSVTIVLSGRGKKAIQTITGEPDSLRISQPKYWDGKWRIVIFDIPHQLKKTRDAFRGHVCRLGLYPLQKSVYVHPYDCRGEINFLIEFHQVRRYVRYIVAEEIDTALHLRQIFKQALRTSAKP